jgi:aminoglycoside phosphotransferase (APT) family kinase protein
VPSELSVAADLVDVDRLSQWLAAELGATGEVTVAPLGEGHSNLTYAVSVGAASWVLRRPPVGPLLPTAHDVVREHHVLELLARADVSVRAPAPVAVCTGDDVLGAPFYLMQRIDGDVVRATPPPWLDDVGRHALGLDLVTAFAEVHRVDPAPFVAAGLGRTDGYLARQLRRWAGQREGIVAAVAAAGGTARELPDYDAVRDWLAAHLPGECAPAVVHGDAKLDNVVVTPPVGSSPPRVAAVLDWEMATVGDPRADLGYLLSFWPEDGDVAPSHPLAQLVTIGAGFPERAALVSTWESATGRTAGDLTWFVTLAVWKLAVLLEASYHRHLAGSTDDPFFATLEQGVPALLAHARDTCGA